MPQERGRPPWERALGFGSFHLPAFDSWLLLGPGGTKGGEGDVGGRVGTGEAAFRLVKSACSRCCALSALDTDPIFFSTSSCLGRSVRVELLFLRYLFPLRFTRSQLYVATSNLKNGKRRLGVLGSRPKAVWAPGGICSLEKRPRLRNKQKGAKRGGGADGQTRGGPRM